MSRKNPFNTHSFLMQRQLTGEGMPKEIRKPLEELENLRHSARQGHSGVKEKIAQLTGPSCHPVVFRLAMSIQIEISTFNLPANKLFVQSEWSLQEKEIEASGNCGYIKGLMFGITNFATTTPTLDQICEKPKNSKTFNEIHKFMEFCIINKIASPVYANIINVFKKSKLPLSLIGLKNDIELLDQNKPENKQEARAVNV